MGVDKVADGKTVQQWGIDDALGFDVDRWQHPLGRRKRQRLIANSAQIVRAIVGRVAQAVSLVSEFSLSVEEEMRNG
jgi:hypothetical protein